MTHWWVNQKTTYRQERDARILWAPILTTNGLKQKNWEYMTEVAVGDTVWHYARGKMMAVGLVTASFVESPRPSDLPADAWEVDGRLVRAHYHEAPVPPVLDEIPLALRLAEPQPGPFTRNGQVKQAYLFPLSEDLANFLTRSFRPLYPAGGPEPVRGLPPEAEDTAVNLLRRLIGVPLTTVTGHPITITTVNPLYVMVTTDRSPDGQRVPVTDVDNALQNLRAAGKVAITPGELGYRSAFVAAVLLTLPGARATGDPTTITIDTDIIDADTSALTFEGDLSIPRDIESRGEQAQLRRAVFGASSEYACALCGDTYPVRFLVAAHIKPRSVATDEQRRDLANIGMSACLFGCDILFETGHLAVDDNGRIVRASDVDGRHAHASRLNALEGRAVVAHTLTSAAYFAWHHGNKFRR